MEPTQQLLAFIAEIKLLKDHVEALNEEIKRFFLEKFPDNPLKNHTRHCEVTEAEIVSEVGEHEQVSLQESLYRDADPVIKQHGSLAFRISKKINKHLRGTFYHLAKNLIANTEKYRNKIREDEKEGVIRWP